MSKYNALIVEDSPTMRQFLGIALARIPGMSYKEANDGIEALQMLNSESFDIVLLDINMPRMDGMRLLQTIRGEERFASTRVVVVTTEGSPDSEEKAMSLGADGYLSKPVNARQVIEAVEGFLPAE